MSNLVEIKKRIESISSTIKVTKVMQMIATAKIAKIKPMIAVVDRYNDSANEILSLFFKNTANATAISKYTNEKNNNKPKNTLLVLFSSDKGTCGSINTNVFKETMEKIQKYKNNNEQITIFPIGKRAVKWLKTNAEKLNVKIYNPDFIADAEYCNSELIGKLTHEIIREYNNDDFDKIEILFHKYKNIITCETTTIQLLPIQIENFNNHDNNFINIDEDDSTITGMMEFYIRTKLYNVYVSNIASIVSSRMNAMDNATKNGKELIDELRIKYNKSRQASITAELSDIVSGSEALN